MTYHAWVRDLVLFSVGVQSVLAARVGGWR